MKSYSVPLDEASAERWDEVFHEIGWRLASKNAQALKPLVEVYESLGAKTFLRVSSDLHSDGLVGKLICWAFEHSEFKVDRFVASVTSHDRKMVEHVNQRAELYECFGEHEKVGRAFVGGVGGAPERASLTHLALLLVVAGLVGFVDAFI
jgi:hypothetical protein